MTKASSFSLILGLGLSALTPIASLADPATAARVAIQAKYDSRNAAMTHKDVSGAMAFYAPNYVGINRKGQQFSLAERQSQMPQMMAMVNKVNRKTVIQKLIVSGTRALAQTRTMMTMTMRDPHSGRLISGANEVVAMDTWVKSGNGWLQEQTQEVESKRLR